MNNEKKKLDCYIVKDLLPLYHDDVVNQNTKEAIKEHLSECKDCIDEYREICADTPVTTCKSTKNQFEKMMDKKRLRQRVFTSFVALISCALLAVTYYALTEVRLVRTDDMEVYEAHQYYTEDGREKFFLLFSTELSGYTPDLDRYVEDGKVIYEFSLKRPVIREKGDEKSIDSANFETGDCDILICDDTIVWSKEANGDDEIPDYVYVQEYFEENNEEKISELMGGEESKSESGLTMFVGDDKTIGFVLGDRTVRWNFDGELIYDSEQEIAESK